MCPDGEKKKKKKKDDDQDKEKWHGEGTGRGKLNHAGDTIGNFKVDMMAACITEINYWESKTKAEGKDKSDKENSRNKIYKQHVLSPSTLSKQMTRKVQGLGPQLGGPRCGRVPNASR